MNSASVGASYNLVTCAIRRSYARSLLNKPGASILIIPVIQWHLNCFTKDGGEELVFTSPAGMPLHHSNFRRRVWLPTLTTAGLADVIADTLSKLTREELKRGSKRTPSGNRSGTQRARNRKQAS